MYITLNVYLQCLRDAHFLHCPVYRVVHFWNIAINNDVRIDHAKDAELHGTFLPDLLRDLVLSLCWF